MNRNELIGTIIGKTLGYTVQGFLYSKIASSINLQSVVLIKTGTRYGIKLIKYTSKNYFRTDFNSETILPDSIEASFFAY